MIIPTSIIEQTPKSELFSPFSLFQQDRAVTRNGPLYKGDVPALMNYGIHEHGIHINASSSQLSALSGTSFGIRESFDVIPTKAHSESVFPHPKKFSGLANYSKQDQMRLNEAVNTRQPPCASSMKCIHALQDDSTQTSIIDTNQHGNLKDVSFTECNPSSINLYGLKGHNNGLLDVGITRRGDRVSKKVVQSGLLSPDNFCYNEAHAPGNHQSCNDLLAPKSVSQRALQTKMPKPVDNNTPIWVSTHIIDRPQESQQRKGEIDIYELPSDPEEVPIAAVTFRNGKRAPAPRITSGARRKPAPTYNRESQKNVGRSALKMDTSHERNARFCSARASYNPTQRIIINYCKPDIPVTAHNSPNEGAQETVVALTEAHCNLGLKSHMKLLQGSKTLSVERPNSVSVVRLPSRIQNPINHSEIHYITQDSSVLHLQTSPVDKVRVGEREDNQEINNSSMIQGPVSQLINPNRSIPQDNLTKSMSNRRHYCKQMSSSEKLVNQLGSRLDNKTPKEGPLNVKETSKPSMRKRVAVKARSEVPRVYRRANIIQEKILGVTPKCITQVTQSVLGINTIAQVVHKTPLRYLTQLCQVLVSSYTENWIRTAKRTRTITPLIPYAESQNKPPCIGIDQIEAHVSEFRVGSHSFALENEQSLHSSGQSASTIPPADPISLGMSSTNIIPLAMPHSREPVPRASHPSTVSISSLEILRGSGEPSPKQEPLTNESKNRDVSIDTAQMPGLQDLQQTDQQAPQCPKIAQRIHSLLPRKPQLAPLSKNGPLDQGCLVQVPRTNPPLNSLSCTNDLEPSSTDRSPPHQVMTGKGISLTIDPRIQSITTTIDTNNAEGLPKQKLHLIQTNTNTKVYNL